jgi:hypothetical protein
MGGLGVLAEIVVLFTGCGPPGGNNANALVPFGVGYLQHSVTVRHADKDQTFLAVVFAVVKALNGKRIVKYRFRQIEAYAVSLLVGLGITS